MDCERSMHSERYVGQLCKLSCTFSLGQQFSVRRELPPPSLPPCPDHHHQRIFGNVWRYSGLSPCMERGATGIYWVESKDAALHRTAHYHKPRMIPSKMSTVLRSKNRNVLDGSCPALPVWQHGVGDCFLPSQQMCTNTPATPFSKLLRTLEWQALGARASCLEPWHLECVSSHRNQITSGRLWALGVVGTIDGLCRWAWHRLMTGNYSKWPLVLQPHATDCKKGTESSPGPSSLEN